MKAKDAAATLLDEDLIAPKEREDAFRQMYVDEFKHRIVLRYGQSPRIMTAQLVAMWKEMSFWASLVIERAGLKTTQAQLDEIFKRDIINQHAKPVSSLRRKS